MLIEKNYGKLQKNYVKKGINAGLIKKIKDLYKETDVTIKIKEGLTRRFTVKKGIRQGCMISSVLFNLYIADIKIIKK